MRKSRHTKTLSERFSSHKVQDLKLFHDEIQEKIQFHLSRKTTDHSNALKSLIELNILINGTFYVEYNNFLKKYRKQYECYADMSLDRIKQFDDGKEYIKIQVIRSDFDGNSLICWMDSGYHRFGLEILDDNQLILEGNIGTFVSFNNDFYQY